MLYREGFVLVTGLSRQGFVNDCGVVVPNRVVCFSCLSAALLPFLLLFNAFNQTIQTVSRMISFTLPSQTERVMK